MKTKSPGLMLALNLHDYQDYAREKIEGAGCIFQPKLNGVRARVSRSGIITRGGNTVLPDLHSEMAPFFRDHPDVELDGELWNNDCGADLNEVLSRLKSNSINLRFFAFDVINHNLQLHRLAALRQFVDEGSISNFDCDQHPIAFGGCAFCETIEEFVQLSVSAIKHEIGEGGIMRFLDGRYKYGRSKDLLKLKFWETEEATVLSEGRDQNGDLQACFVQFPSGATLGCNVGGSAEYWRTQGSLLGKTVFVKFMLVNEPLNGTVVGVAL